MLEISAFWWAFRCQHVWFQNIQQLAIEQSPQNPVDAYARTWGTLCCYLSKESKISNDVRSILVQHANQTKQPSDLYGIVCLVMCRKASNVLRGMVDSVRPQCGFRALLLLEKRFDVKASDSNYFPIWNPFPQLASKFLTSLRAYWFEMQSS